MPSPTREASLEDLVRFCHPRKIVAGTRLPGVEALEDAVLAAMYGTTAVEYREVVRRIRAEADAAALDLVSHPAFETALANGAGVLALGDSITDDLASWAAMLGAAGAEILDAGLSGDTTANALARRSRLPPADLAIVLLGTNDARRHGRDGAPVLVSDAETARNVRVLDGLLRRRCRRVLWVTPPPIVEERVLADDGLREADLLWRLDDVRRKAAIVRAAVPEAVDLWPRYGDPPPPELLRPDGLHPSLAGQRLIAGAVLDALGARRS